VRKNPLSELYPSLNACRPLLAIFETIIYGATWSSQEPSFSRKYMSSVEMGPGDDRACPSVPCVSKCAAALAPYIKHIFAEARSSGLIESRNKFALEKSSRSICDAATTVILRELTSSLNAPQHLRCHILNTYMRSGWSGQAANSPMKSLQDRNVTTGRKTFAVCSGDFYCVAALTLHVLNTYLRSVLIGLSSKFGLESSLQGWNGTTWGKTH
jgi:hypothetical protein